MELLKLSKTVNAKDFKAKENIAAQHQVAVEQANEDYHAENGQ